MAFTEAQKVKLRKLLGWPAYATSDITLESAMDLIGANPAAQAEVEGVLANVESIETEIAGLHGIALAEKVEESSLNPRRYSDLRTAGRREVRQLSILLNTEVRMDVFGTGWTGGALRLG